MILLCEEKRRYSFSGYTYGVILYVRMFIILVGKSTKRTAETEYEGYLCRIVDNLQREKAKSKRNATRMFFAPEMVWTPFYAVISRFGFTCRTLQMEFELA